MNFESISIKNFRNFENTEIALSNKNAFFGLNDVGKTNFLFALRYVFDKDIRKLNLLESDYFNRQTNQPVEIVVKIDISDIDCIDNQKLRAKVKGAITSSSKSIYIKLVAEYDKVEMVGIPILTWGGDKKNLKEVKQRGYLYDIDHVFNVIYIDSYVDLYSLFKKNAASLIKNDDEADNTVLDTIQDTIDSLNTHISSLSGIKGFEEKVTPEYKKFRNENISISVKSEIAVKGLYSNIVPYIKRDDDENLYPTSGEGRKKLLAYSIFDIISASSMEKKVNIFLIEEPENHLHKSMQIALSKILFTDSKYKYLFISTHSPYVLYDMDNLNLVRIYNASKIDSASSLYKVPQEFKDNKKLLNRSLSEALFADKVLLVEGPSEFILFEKVLSCVYPDYEANGAYILPVEGVGFKKYFLILEKLKISTIIKTDNDLRSTKTAGSYSVLGFIRCNKYICDKLLPEDRISDNSIAAKNKLYCDHKDILDDIRDNYDIYLSKSDLENDLDEVLHEKLVEYLGTDDTVDYLQSAKHYKMVELSNKLTKTDCEIIYNHYNFACLKELVK